MIVGLTGGIGSGKSAVSGYFKDLAVVVIDADQVARDVVVVGSPALTSIESHFGSQILLEGGGLDRAALRQRIFSDAPQKRWLEQLLHPLIGAAIDAQLAAALAQKDHCGYVVLESPLLLETQQHAKTDYIVVVDATEAQQLERAGRRDTNTAEQISAIIASQMPRQQRLDQAQWVLNNQHDQAHLHQQVLTLHQHLCQLADPKT
jgi:dephospho-CoA kinase